MSIYDTFQHIGDVPMIAQFRRRQVCQIKYEMLMVSHELRRMEDRMRTLEDELKEAEADT